MTSTSNSVANLACTKTQMATLDLLNAGFSTKY